VPLLHPVRSVGILAALAIVLQLGLAATARAEINLNPDEIRAALHTASQEEDGFVDRTVALVKAGKLPLALFESSFLWARRKQRHQFEYFKRALIVRAAEAGITLR
jgi:hypothetical protein